MQGFDVIVLGTGPAGLAAAEASARQGLRVAVVSPRPAAVWPNFYGLWSDEANALGIEGQLAERWERVELRLSAEERYVLPRGYARIDNPSLFSRLQGGAARAGAVFFKGTAASVARGARARLVTFDDGRALEGWAVLDATGHRSERRRGRVEQMAYGVVLVPSRSLLDPDTPRLMDFSGVPGADPREPTFLYALPLSGGRFLLEETSLARAPALPLATVQERLARRLAHLGVDGEVSFEERSFIPLTPPLPARDGLVIPLGSAASLVNPATGYMIPAALRHAREVASLLAEGRRAGRPFDEVALAAWDLTWPPEQRLVRRLRLFGIDVLRRLDLEGTRRFFAALLSATPDGWRAFLSFDALPDELAAVMLETFRALPRRLQIRTTLGLSRHLGLLAHLTREGGITRGHIPRRSHVG